MNLNNVKYLGFEILYQKEFDFVFSKIEEEMKKLNFLSKDEIGFKKLIKQLKNDKESNFKSYFMKTDVFFFKHFQKFIKSYLKNENDKIYTDENFEILFKEKPPIYWWMFFKILFHNFDYFKFPELNDKFFDVLFDIYLPEVFNIYDEEEYIVPKLNFVESISLFSKISNGGRLNRYLNKNFEKMHENISSFCFLTQYNVTKPFMYDIFEDYFSKFYKDYMQIEDRNYQNFLKFWMYLIKFQEVPIKYVYKFIKNFQDVPELKYSLNYSDYSIHYWQKLEVNRKIYNSLKIFNS